MRATIVMRRDASYRLTVLSTWQRHRPLVVSIPRSLLFRREKEVMGVPPPSASCAELQPTRTIETARRHATAHEGEGFALWTGYLGFTTASHPSDPPAVSSSFRHDNGTKLTAIAERFAVTQPNHPLIGHHHHDTHHRRQDFMGIGRGGNEDHNCSTRSPSPFSRRKLPIETSRAVVYLFSTQCDGEPSLLSSRRNATCPFMFFLYFSYMYNIFILYLIDRKSLG